MIEASMGGRPVDLAGQVALVTGASGGLGRHFATLLASAGASVAVTARRLDRLEQLAREIDKAGGHCVPIVLDVTDSENIVSAVGTAAEALGTVTILVNNAGIPDAQRAHKMSVESIDAVLDTNLRGPWLMACEVARRLIAAEQPGRIINIASTAAYRYDGSRAAALYATTKSAVVRMTEVLAVEWLRYGINVNAISPGAFHSEMMDGMIERVGDPSEHFPRKRMGQPPNLDSTLLYLLHPASEFVTGTIIKVDDGQPGR